MKKVANSYYSSAVEHMNGFHATFGIPGSPPFWVNRSDGERRIFQSRDEALLSGFKGMVSKLNMARQDQEFYTKGDKPKSNIRSWSAPKANGEHTIDSVFGKNGR